MILSLTCYIFGLLILECIVKPVFSGDHQYSEDYVRLQGPLVFTTVSHRRN